MRIVQCLLVLFTILGVISGCSVGENDNDVIFQTSTINALLSGVYDGRVTYKELKEHGNFGLGTLDALDGEMIGLGGKFYQIKIDGNAYPINDQSKTPFAVVTFFEKDNGVKLNDSYNYEQLGAYIDDLLPTMNIFYAILIDGTFEYIKARSVPRQTKPYLPLAEVIKDQKIFEFHNVEGTIVAFRSPTFVNGGVNVPGYHMHFITGDRTKGGHLLECQTQSVHIQIDYSERFYMELPDSDEFYNINLEQDKQEELGKVEK